MNVLVFGGGAVGLGLSSCLMAAGVTPDIVARKNTVDALKSRGLSRTGLIGDAFFENVKAYESLDRVPGKEVYDFILVCTKSNDTAKAARILSESPGMIKDSTCIVLCQNGWGNREIFIRYFPERQVYNARVITGFHRHAPNHVDITVHVQPVNLGSIHHNPSPELVPLRDAIRKGGLTSEITDCIDKDLWAKMLFNCSLNPLGAIFDVPYGELKKSEHTRAVMEDIVREIFLVLDASGNRSYWENYKDYFGFLIDTLIPGTAKHESSTLQDIRMKKPTEIDALTGAVVALAEKHNVDVPVNRMLYRMIRFMEGRY
jgi:2-dehydropantoate 2-reductase